MKSSPKDKERRIISISAVQESLWGMTTTSIYGLDSNGKVYILTTTPKGKQKWQLK